MTAISAAAFAVCEFAMMEAQNVGDCRQKMRWEYVFVKLYFRCSDRYDDQVADRTSKAFELSQSLAERWVIANYDAKRTILSILLKTVRLNCGNLEFSPREPFDLLRDENLVSLSDPNGI